MNGGLHKFTAPPLKIALQNLKHACRQLDVFLTGFWIAREGRHAVFGFNQGAGSELDRELHRVHLFVVKCRLRKGKSQHNLVRLVQLPCQGLGLLKVVNRCAHQRHSAEARKKGRHVARHVAVHPQQQNTLDCYKLLNLKLRFLRNNWLRVKQSEVFEALLQVTLALQSNQLFGT